MEALPRADSEVAPPEERVGRNAYRLTPKGESLKPVLKAVADWGLQHIEGTAASMISAR